MTMLRQMAADVFAIKAKLSGASAVVAATISDRAMVMLGNRGQR